MRAVATDGRGGLEVLTVPRPRPGEHGALLKVDACGFCGSDLDKVRDHALPAGRVLGHEVVGHLLEDGSLGHRVAVAHHVPCGRCLRCRSGHSSLCGQFVNSELDPGGFSEFVAVSRVHLDNAAFALPARIGDLEGTLVEPISCVLRALDTAAGLLGAYPLPGVLGAGAPDGGPDEWRGAETAIFGGGRSGRVGELEDRDVLVAGCGSVGLLFLSLLRAAAHLPAAGSLHPGRLFYLEPDPERAALAESLGARPWSPDQPVGVAFLTAPPAFPQLVAALPEGAVLLVFAAAAEEVSLPLERLYRRELAIAGVRSGSPQHLRRAVELLGSGRLDLSWFRPLEVDFTELPAAVARYARGDVLKVVARP